MTHYALIDMRTSRWQVVGLPRYKWLGLLLKLFAPQGLGLFRRASLLEQKVVAWQMPRNGWLWVQIGGQSGYCYFASPNVAVGFHTMNTGFHIQFENPL